MRKYANKHTNNCDYRQFIAKFMLYNIKNSGFVTYYLSEKEQSSRFGNPFRARHIAT